MRSKTTMQRRGTFVFTSLLGVAAVAAIALGGAGVDPAPIAPHLAAPPAVDTMTLMGKPAPEFSLPTLDNKEVKLAGQKGKVVMLDFWATWCPPCRASLPHVQKIAADEQRLKKGLVVWVIDDKEDAPVVESFLKENKYTFTVPMDKGGEVLGKYLVRGIPTTVVIGRDGVIRKVFIGYGADTGKAVDEAVDAALGEAEVK
ncbi:MAG TPA: redoxin domain-containing protein [Tepidisphaeraceae bacterium]|jgi:thiol-disulfide isomerase/thioredoxin